MDFTPKKDELKYVNGAATITILPESKVRICYLDKVNKQTKVVTEITFADGEKCKIYGFDELPLQFSAEDEGVEVVWRVKSEGSKILEFLPENEAGLDGKFVEFYRSNGKDTNPIPTEAKKFKETDADMLQFCAIFKIEEGVFAGKTVSQYLQFSKSGISKAGNEYSFSTFVKNEANGKLALGFQPLPDGSTGYTWSDRIYNLRHCGLLDLDVAFPEDGNPLLLIEQHLQRQNKTVKMDIERGYVTTISSAKKMKATLTPKVEAPANPDEM